MPAVLSPGVTPALRFLDHLFGSVPPRDVSFRLWEGTAWPDAQRRPATLVLKHPGALRAMFGPGNELGLAEAYLADDFDIAGDVEAACGLAGQLESRPEGWRAALGDYLHFHRLPTAAGSAPGWRTFATGGEPPHTLARDRAAVSFHYDLSNDFYRLWLDERMIYSCAYFTSPDDGLDAAQAAKLRHLTRKLRLRPGQRLLDIGCGWGGLALHAAREHGVEVTGLTLSTRQAEFAAQRVRDAGLTGRVRIELRDYRELREPEGYDAIVSVGMSEHVGAGRLPEYFRHAAALLKPGGVFLNHAIGEGARPRRHHGPSFIEKHVFPDAHIPPIPSVLAAAEAAGLEVRDVENLREHYALTLRHWVRRIEARHAEARQHVDEPTYRIWRLYLAGSAHGFAHGHLAIYQALLAKPDGGGDAHLPLTRDDWYPRP
ncbi:MAG: class I SAM-dependent methyltransferase [Opitutaceae bacterium]|nr:class I SAM-dependent methyltransferase [Opitutaceae bacterium]